MSSSHKEICACVAYRTTIIERTKSCVSSSHEISYRRTVYIYAFRRALPRGASRSASPIGYKRNKESKENKKIKGGTMLTW